MPIYSDIRFARACTTQDDSTHRTGNQPMKQEFHRKRSACGPATTGCTEHATIERQLPTSRLRRFDWREMPMRSRHAVSMHDRAKDRLAEASPGAGAKELP